MNWKLMLVMFLCGLAGYLTGAVLMIVAWLFCIYCLKTATAGVIVSIILFPLAIYLGCLESKLICRKLL